MDWAKTANIATVVESIVVVVSVILILIQLRLQTKLTRIANTHALVEISSPFNLELIKDPAMAALWIKGVEDYDTFDEVKKYQYKSLLIWWLIFQENIFFRTRRVYWMRRFIVPGTMTSGCSLRGISENVGLS